MGFLSCTIKAEIPEVKKDDVKVTVDNGVLTLRGKGNRKKRRKDKFHQVERLFGKSFFTRSFKHPDNVDVCIVPM